METWPSKLELVLFAFDALGMAAAIMAQFFVAAEIYSKGPAAAPDTRLGERLARVECGERVYCPSCERLCLISHKLMGLYQAGDSIPIWAALRRFRCYECATEVEHAARVAGMKSALSIYAICSAVRTITLAVFGLGLATGALWIISYLVGAGGYTKHFVWVRYNAQVWRMWEERQERMVYSKNRTLCAELKGLQHAAIDRC
ncbi:MAG: hypothetical protein KDA50_00430 [Rhodobacteraceae bacterium]|nr:hypothetical protein [Paracoccaceae bacterium]